ncbi:MAG: sigma-70 family RNA polymerase sigma factor [Cellulosilyticaceae bacterium]
MKGKLKENKVIEYTLEYKESMYRLAYSYTRNEQDALDIVQESICKALTSLDSLKEINYVKTWMYRIIVNTALDYLRKNKKYIYQETLDEGCLYDTYENIDLKEALDKLEEPYQTIVKLRYFEDLQINEIAQVLQQNENTIKTRLYTALKKLRIKIK